MKITCNVYRENRAADLETFRITILIYILYYYEENKIILMKKKNAFADIAQELSGVSCCNSDISRSSFCGEISGFKIRKVRETQFLDQG